MGVKIRQLGGDSLAVFFDDSGNQAAGALPFGWAQNVFTAALVAPLAILGMRIGTFSDASTGFEMFPVQHSQNNPTTVYKVFVFPVELYNTSLRGRNQFVQATFFEQNALTAGPALLTTCDIGATLNGYFFHKDGFVERVNNNVVTDVNAVSFGAFAQNDVVRMSVDIQSTQNVFTVKKNGVTVATVTDNSVNRITTGCPGWIGFTTTGVVAAAHSRWKVFSAGAGA